MLKYFLHLDGGENDIHQHKNQPKEDRLTTKNKHGVCL